ncbi:MAG: SUMF1/EgtB/PvdO family nonheme iron enzyme [Deltaproteobacteria bacterium]|nr:SUMF1/EgtB/PvdO family nonheme iron enzyme [Deltaproteobacteria bacterium]
MNARTRLWPWRILRDLQNNSRPGFRIMSSARLSRAGLTTRWQARPLAVPMRIWWQCLFMRRTAVTNAEYLEFVHASGYRPKDAQNFLRQLPREGRGELPRKVSPALAALPVTYVSLADARAYAAWKHQRLPSEAEWQWAAEGAGLGNRWPWGNDDARARDAGTVNTTGKIAGAGSYIHGGTTLGILGLTGNTWELTESEYSDGHTRFALLRGGSYLPTGQSEWLTARGPRPNGFHAKYILMGEGLDRSEAISFRTVAD